MEEHPVDGRTLLPTFWPRGTLLTHLDILKHEGQLAHKSAQLGGTQEPSRIAMEFRQTSSATTKPGWSAG